MENQPVANTSSSILYVKPPRSVTIAAAGLFAALAILLTSISQSLVLSFPLIPYLQFDLGEVAIVLALLLFGPVPALAAGFVEFVTLMGFGVNAPYGPVLKLIAVLSSIAGLWLGAYVAKKWFGKSGSQSSMLGTSLAFGLLSRVGILTVANYYLVVFIYGLTGPYGIIDFVRGPLQLVGISITNSNAISLILSLTAVFNALQLILVFAISYLVVREPHVRRSLRSNRMAWFEFFGTRVKPT